MHFSYSRTDAISTGVRSVWVGPLFSRRHLPKLWMQTSCCLNCGNHLKNENAPKCSFTIATSKIRGGNRSTILMPFDINSDMKGWNIVGQTVLVLSVLLPYKRGTDRSVDRRGRVFNTTELRVSQTNISQIDAKRQLNQFSGVCLIEV